VVAVDVVGGGFDPGFGEEFADGFEEALVGDGRAGPASLARGAGRKAQGARREARGGWREARGVWREARGAGQQRGGDGVSFVVGVGGLEFEDAAAAAQQVVADGAQGAGRRALGAGRFGGRGGRTHRRKRR